jgi:protein-disulfide isomerase
MPDCAQLCIYFTYCRAQRWTPHKHLAKLILACTTQCKNVKPGTEAQKLFEGIKRCAVNRSCVDLVACLESLQAKIQAAKPKIDPDAIYKVPLAGSPTRGPADALVTVVMFSNHECGFCRRAYKVMLAALKKHPKTLRLVYKHFPLSDNTGALLSARAAACVAKQKGQAAFWAFHDKAVNADDLSQTELLAHAKTAGADPQAVSRCLKAKQGLPTVKADRKLGENLGIDGTPTLYVNGKRYPGYLSPPALEEAIVEARARAQAAVKSGVKPARVYQHLTAKGATKLKYLPPKRPAPRPR